jgi:hypothetical protein
MSVDGFKIALWTLVLAFNVDLIISHHYLAIVLEIASIVVIALTVRERGSDAAITVATACGLGSVVLDLIIIGGFRALSILITAIAIVQASLAEADSQFITTLLQQRLDAMEKEKVSHKCPPPIIVDCKKCALAAAAKPPSDLGVTISTRRITRRMSKQE